MIDKINKIPEKVAFAIGLTLVLTSGLFLFLMSLLFEFSNLTMMIVQAMIWGIAIIFVLSASDKRHSRINKQKK
ncbi:hypothetical protein [Sutcliffiella halmapala]|uniref:hypothetical protein n=1 Tax=Sutcliffiella halmapala TaxID=79882 RepID=UPI000994BC41|nr:hypothetical protein [Sutcliffiella halmapala]